MVGPLVREFFLRLPLPRRVQKGWGSRTQNGRPLSAYPRDNIFEQASCTPRSNSVFSLTIKGLKFFSWICQGRNAKFSSPPEYTPAPSLPRGRNAHSAPPSEYAPGSAPSLPRGRNAHSAPPPEYAPGSAPSLPRGRNAHFVPPPE